MSIAIVKKIKRFNLPLLLPVGTYIIYANRLNCPHLGGWVITWEELLDDFAKSHRTAIFGANIYIIATITVGITQLATTYLNPTLSEML